MVIAAPPISRTQRATREIRDRRYTTGREPWAEFNPDEVYNASVDLRESYAAFTDWFQASPKVHLRKLPDLDLVGPAPEFMSHRLSRAPWLSPHSPNLGARVTDTDAPTFARVTGLHIPLLMTSFALLAAIAVINLSLLVSLHDSALSGFLIGFFAVAAYVARSAQRANYEHRIAYGSYLVHPDYIRVWFLASAVFSIEAALLTIALAL